MAIPCVYYMNGKGDPGAVAHPHPQNFMIVVAKIPVPTPPTALESLRGSVFGTTYVVLYQCVDCKMIKPGTEADMEEVEAPEAK